MLEIDDDMLTKNIHMIITKNEKIEARRVLKEIYASISLILNQYIDVKLIM